MSSSNSINNINTACNTTSIPTESQVINISAGGYLQVTASLLDTALVTITVTDANGCTWTKQVPVYAEDVRCFAGNSGIAKVAICHQTGSSKNPCVQICVDQAAVQEHLAHGDFVGNCTSNCQKPANYGMVLNNAIISAPDLANPDKLSIKVMPNPTSFYFTMNIQSKNKDKVKLTIMDIAGRVIEQRTDVPANSTLQIGSKYHPGMYFAEVMQGKDRVVLKLIKEGQ